MKTSMLTAILAVLFSVTLFFTGIYFYDKFFEWTVPDIEGIKFSVSTIGWHFTEMLKFAFTLALIPVSAFLNWKFAPIIMPKRKLLNISILVACIIICALLRKSWLMYQANIYLRSLPEAFGNKLQYQIPVENFNVTNYMLLGLAVGTAISYFTLKQKKAAR